LASCILLMEPCADRMKPNVGTNFKFFWRWGWKRTENLICLQIIFEMPPDCQ
jgi:hypothetical protein